MRMPWSVDAYQCPGPILDDRSHGLRDVKIGPIIQTENVKSTSEVNQSDPNAMGFPWIPIDTDVIALAFWFGNVRPCRFGLVIIVG